MKGERVHLSVAFWPPFPQARPAEGTPSQCTALLRTRPFPPTLPIWSFTTTLGAGPHTFHTGEKTLLEACEFPKVCTD